MHKGRLAGGLLLGVTGVLVACGDDVSGTNAPATAISDSDGGATVVDAADVDAPADDDGGALDAQTTAPDSGGGAITACTGGTPSDAGAPTPAWTAAAPTPVAGATPTLVKTIANGACALSVAWVQIPHDPLSQYLVYLHKTDAPGATCGEATGYAPVLTTNFEAPTVIVEASALDPRLFVVGATEVTGTSQSGIHRFEVAQYDWTTGAQLHLVRLASKAAEGTALPPNTPSVVSLSVDGCTLDVHGNGSVPGAVGTGAFVAEYANFLAPFPQSAAYADSVTY